MKADMRVALRATVWTVLLLIGTGQLVVATWPGIGVEAGERAGVAAVMLWVVWQWLSAWRVQACLRSAVAGGTEKAGPGTLAAMYSLAMFEWISRPVLRAARPGAELQVLDGHRVRRARVLARVRLAAPAGARLTALMVDAGDGPVPVLPDFVISLED